MKQYVLDANAVMRYLSNGSGEEKVAMLIQRAAKGEARLLISVINWGEVLYSLARLAGLNKATADLKALGAIVESVDADEDQAEAAASLKFRYKMGYADTYAAALAMRTGATLVTADPAFAKLGKQLKVLALPRHVR
ncbi:MAG: PIN domain-containing protein [Terracidiphilus sp.]